MIQDHDTRIAKNNQINNNDSWLKRITTAKLVSLKNRKKMKAFPKIWKTKNTRSLMRHISLETSALFSPHNFQPLAIETEYVTIWFFLQDFFFNIPWKKHHLESICFSKILSSWEKGMWPTIFSTEGWHNPNQLSNNWVTRGTF